MNSGSPVTTIKDGKICVYQQLQEREDGQLFQLSLQIEDSKFYSSKIAFYTPWRNDKKSIPIYSFKIRTEYGDNFFYVKRFTSMHKI